MVPFKNSTTTTPDIYRAPGKATPVNTTHRALTLTQHREDRQSQPLNILTDTPLLTRLISRHTELIQVRMFDWASLHPSIIILSHSLSLYLSIFPPFTWSYTSLPSHPFLVHSLPPHFRLLSRSPFPRSFHFYLFYLFLSLFFSLPSPQSYVFI